MKNDLLLLQYCCVDILKIQKPVEIRIFQRVKKKPHCDFAGWYETRFSRGKIIKHVIFVNLVQVLNSEFDLYGVIAHEFIHVHQMEHKRLEEGNYHGEYFQKVADVLEHYLTNTGFDTGPLYSPLTDTD